MHRASPERPASLGRIFGKQTRRDFPRHELPEGCPGVTGPQVQACLVKRGYKQERLVVRSNTVWALRQSELD